MIKDFLLEKEQQKFFILPSISLKTNECTEENEDENGNNDEGLIDKSVKIDLINSMSNLDLNNETNKKLVKNIAKSVI